MDLLITGVGIVAAGATAGANLPQVLKCWRTGDTEALSLRMLSLLTFGFACWIAYGFFRGDYVIVGANSVSISLALALLWFKARNGWQ